MKFLIPCILFLLFALPAAARKIIIEQTTPNGSQTVSIPNAAPTISDNEWKIVIDALNTENWNTAVFYSSSLVNRLKEDNERKQTAQLRYFYLYALAGQILKANQNKKPEDEKAAWRELSKAVESFIGKEFLLPAREFRGGCERAVNLVCAVQGKPKTYRTSASSKDLTGIHSFDYVVLQSEIDLRGFLGKQVFLSGTLKKVEFNDELSFEKSPWVMYLIFEKGFARVVDEK